MIPILLNVLKSLFVPQGILFALIYFAPRFLRLPQDLWPYAGTYPVILFVAAALLCWRFHKDRYVFVLAGLALCERAIYFHLINPEQGLSPGWHEAVGILLPIHLVLFELLPDRGVLTFRGSLKWAIVAVEAGFLAAAGGRMAPALAWAEDLRVIFDQVAALWPSGFPEKGPTAFGAALLILLIRFMLRPRSSESTSLWALVLLYAGLHADAGAPAVYYLSFASVLYIGTIIDTSYRLAFHDELTGLPARRALNDRLARLSSKYAIAMVDIDYFKKFNDTHGHDIGDQVLRMVASRLSRVSGGGRAYRYGGEEFAIVFAGGSVKRATPCLERLRRQIEETPFAFRGFGRAFKKKTRVASPKRRTARITVSIGVAERCERHPDTRAVVKAADSALYRAKRSGRNRVAVG